MSENTTETQTDTEQKKSAAARTTGIAVVVIIVAVVVAVLWWWLSADSQGQQSNNKEQLTETATQQQQVKQAEPTPVIEQPKPAVEQSAATEEQAPEPAPEPVEQPEPKPELPPLNESTPTVLQTLDSSGIAIQPLKSSQLIRDTVVIIDNLGNGSLVRDRTIVQRPDGRFSVIEVDGQLYIDEESYQRYDALVDWFVSLEPQALLENYKLFKPLLQEAYAEIGYPDKSFNDAIIEAINTLLDTPVPETLVAVEDDEVMYTYTNPAYEALPPAQKQLLRMGPDNIERVKAQLRDIKQVFQANL